MMKSMNRFASHSAFRLGFTMVELLLVITIIGIISALAATNLARTQKAARDTTRRTHVKALQDAMEQFYANYGIYSNGCTSTNLATYLPGGMPADPGNQTISCTVTGGGADYCALATLENNTEGNCDANCNAQAGGPAFCLKNLQ